MKFINAGNITIVIAILTIYIGKKLVDKFIKN